MVHQRIQKQRKREALLRGAVYESEVSLAITCPYREFDFEIDFVIEGRADGVCRDEGRLYVEEIKSALRLPDAVDDTHWHFAQAKCYAYMLRRRMLALGPPPVDLSSVTIQLTYCDVDSYEHRTFAVTLSAEALEAFFMDIVARYYIFAKMDYDRVEMRNTTAKALPFPYPEYRKSQRELAISVYAAIKGGKKLFAQAPTGTGKTVSTLFPAVKALGEGLADKIFYATAKTITRQVAVDTLLTMAREGLVMRAVVLTAKDKICPYPDAACRPEECDRADGHFDRVNNALLDVIRNETTIQRGEVERYATKHRVCPFELALDLSNFCDVVVCDYNHVYDPRAQLKRFFGGDKRNPYVVLNDEAHNLVDRAREMFSAEIGLLQLKTARKALPRHSPVYKGITQTLAYMEDKLENLRDSETEALAELGLPKNLCEALQELAGRIDLWLVEHKLPAPQTAEDRLTARDKPQGSETNSPNEGGDAFDLVLELYFRVLDFLQIAEKYDERYITFSRRFGRDLTVKLLCLDPSHLLSETESLVKASIFFSATLTPLSYFREILGGEESDFLLRLSSPFARENLCVMIDRNVSAQYKHRERSYGPIAEGIATMVTSKPGNYFVFFSSYEYLERAYGVFTASYPHIRTSVQRQGMTESEKEAFLADFSAENTETLVGFVTLGGVFSEGIDLVGDRLSGVAVVGVGLPLITAERNAISEYYSRTGRDGFAFAYVYPGMNKVMQAVGRVIRSHSDRGVALLMDTRFTFSQYNSLFPAEWAEHRVLHGAASIEECVKRFWKEYGR